MTFYGLFRSPGSTRIAITSRLHPRDRRKNPSGSASFGSDGRWCCYCSVEFAPAQHGPGDARHLIGERHGDQPRRLAVEQPAQPGDPAGDVLALVADQAGGADHQKTTEIAVAGFGDAAEPLFAAG